MIKVKKLDKTAAYDIVKLDQQQFLCSLTHTTFTIVYTTIFTYVNSDT